MTAGMVGIFSAAPAILSDAMLSFALVGRGSTKNRCTSTKAYKSHGVIQQEISLCGIPLMPLVSKLSPLYCGDGTINYYTGINDDRRYVIKCQN